MWRRLSLTGSGGHRLWRLAGTALFGYAAGTPPRSVAPSEPGSRHSRPYTPLVPQPRILAVASAVDLDFRYGCTPAWWQLWKGLYEAGVDLIVTPYRGRPIESPWWRTAPNPTYREGESYAALRSGLARMKGDRYLRRAEASPEDTAFDKLTRETIWKVVTPRWRRHLDRLIARERPDAVLVFTVPMAHFRGIPTYLRERHGIPVAFYDGDVPMSLPEFGGMDTGFNYYHGADPSEYDLVISNSEGGLQRLVELGARRAEAVPWAADPEFFRPMPVEKDVDVFFYGYGDKFRREWMAALVGEPSTRDPRIDFALGGRDFRGDTRPGAARRRRPVQRLRAGDLGGANQPQHHASCACDASTARRPAGRSSSPRPAPRSSRTPTRASSGGSSPVQEIIVVEDADGALVGVSRSARRPGRGGRDGGPRPRARARRAHVRSSGAKASAPPRARSAGAGVSKTDRRGRPRV